MDDLFGGNSGLGLFGCDGTECHEEFVIYCMSIVEKRHNNFLDAVLAGIIKERRYITFRRELGFGAIGDRQACVARESWLERARIFELEKQIVNVPGHAEAAEFARIIPLDSNASKFVSGHVTLHTMEVFK
jgi:hypothetical protein